MCCIVLLSATAHDFVAEAPPLARLLDEGADINAGTDPLGERGGAPASDSQDEADAGSDLRHQIWREVAGRVGVDELTRDRTDLADVRHRVAIEP